MNCNDSDSEDKNNYVENDNNPIDNINDTSDNYDRDNSNNSFTINIYHVL